MLSVVILLSIGTFFIIIGCRIVEKTKVIEKKNKEEKRKKRFLEMQTSEHHDCGHRQYIGTIYNSLNDFF